MAYTLENESIGTSDQFKRNTGTFDWNAQPEASPETQFQRNTGTYDWSQENPEKDLASLMTPEQSLTSQRKIFSGNGVGLPSAGLNQEQMSPYGYSDLKSKISDTEKMALGGLDEELKGVLGFEKAKNKQLQENINKIGEQNAAKDKLENEYIQRNAQRAKDREAQVQKLSDAVKDLDKVKPDPNKWWASRSTGQKLSLGIGVFLAGVGGSGNRVLDMMDQEIKRDVEAQKSLYEQKKDMIETDYKIMKERYGDVIPPEKLTYYMGLQKADRAVALQMMKSNNQMVKANGQRLQGIIKQKKAQVLKSAFGDMVALQGAYAEAASSNQAKISGDESKRAAQGVNALKSIKKLMEMTEQGKWRHGTMATTNWDAELTKAVQAEGFMNSGANVPKDEVEGFKKGYTTFMSNDKETFQKLQEKAKEIASFINSFGIDKLPPEVKNTYVKLLQHINDKRFKAK